MTTDIIIESFLDAAADSLAALPFLIAAFALMELLEKHSDKLTERLFSGVRRSGPLIGALLGLVPQCGFSAAMSNLYAGGIVSLGTLIAVFLATSDEAVLIMMSSPGYLPEILPLLVSKFIIALFFGFAVDFIMRGRQKNVRIDDICIKCGCGDGNGILKPALRHTFGVFGWLIAISFILNLLLETIGSEALSAFLGSDLIFQPLITALVGLIPNCAVSVLFTRLYLTGSISFASAVAGLCSGAGLGLIVLFRIVRDKKEAVLATAILYICASAAGMALSFI